MQKRSGSGIDVEMGGAVVRLLGWDDGVLPDGVEFVATLKSRARNNAYRYSFTVAALRDTIDRLEAWDGKAVSADSPHGTSRALHWFLRKAEAELEKAQG